MGVLKYLKEERYIRAKTADVWVVIDESCCGVLLGLYYMVHDWIKWTVIEFVNILELEKHTARKQACRPNSFMLRKMPHLSWSHWPISFGPYPFKRFLSIYVYFTYPLNILWQVNHVLGLQTSLPLPIHQQNKWRLGSLNVWPPSFSSSSNTTFRAVIIDLNSALWLIPSKFPLTSLNLSYDCWQWLKAMSTSLAGDAVIF